MNVPAGQGVLAIRDAERTQALGSPTKVTGTVDDETGAISGATFSTPPLKFQTVALNFPVEVTATFTQVAPGTGTGLVAATPPAVSEGQDQPGQVTLRTSVRVDLDLRIRDPRSGAVILEPHCVAPTVQLELISQGTYTRSAGGKLVDPDFTVPPVEANSTDCIAEVASGVNGLLAGSGHSLSLFIEGDLPVPPLKAETTTTLSVAPSAGSVRGTDVTLTATVAEVEPNDAAPSGSVVFKDGARNLGTAELRPDGTASLTTAELRSGNRSLAAAYQGDAEFAPSQSAPLAYAVAPAPILTGTFPENIARGAVPTEFDLSIDNVGSSRPMANGRVDIRLPGLNSGDLVLERQLPDATWAPVPLSFAPDAGGPGIGGLVGTLGPPGGTVLPANAVETVRMRVSAAGNAPIKLWNIGFDLVVVDPSSGDDGPTVASGSWPFDIIEATRRATTTTVYVYDAALRPGQQLYVDAVVATTAGAATTGQVEFLLDGKVMSFQPFQALGAPLPRTTRAPVDANGYASARLDLPADISTGPHVVSARYLGNTSYRPSAPQGLPGALDGPHVLQVIDPLGPVYDCGFVGVTSISTGGFVQAYALLPAHAEDGEEVAVEDLEVTLTIGGIDTPGWLSLMHSSGAFGVSDIEIDLGTAGSIDGTGVIWEPGSEGGDQHLRLQGLEGSIVVTGEPGEVMPLPIERIVMTGIEATVSSNFTFTCMPHAAPVVFDEVGVAGVALAVGTSSAVVRVGDPVTLTATVGPAGPFGLVEFFSGSESLGTAPGASGTASITVDDLPAGPNSLSARYTGVRGSPFRSNVVALDVQPAVDCAAFAESGHGATVRLVYIELLGRCPDQAGFDFWTGRLAGGTSSEVFARSIARTPEAVGQVVDDAYWTMLGRAPDAAGRAFWVNRMRTGSGRYDQLLADLGASAEFWNLAGATRAGFVTRVYQQLLNRAPDEPGLDYWAARLTPGASRRTLILSLANLDEPLGRLVGLSYDEILGRAPSGTERTDGIGVLRRTGDRSGFYAQLIGQPEFSTRAQGFPNSED